MTGFSLNSKQALSKNTRPFHWNSRFIGPKRFESIPQGHLDIILVWERGCVRGCVCTPVAVCIWKLL